MNPAQRRWRILLLVLLALATSVWLVATVAGRFLAAPIPSPSISPLPPACAQEPAAWLTGTGLTGQVTLRPDGVLTVEVVPPSGWSDGQAAQLVWTALDAVAFSLSPECTYQQLEIMVLAAETRLRAQVSAADLQAWAAGALDDASLSDRVLYYREPYTPVP